MAVDLFDDTIFDINKEEGFRKFKHAFGIVNSDKKITNENKKYKNMNRKNTVRLTESDIHNMVKEAVDKALEYSRIQKEWYMEEKAKYENLVNFLHKLGIKSASLSSEQSGMPLIVLDAREYYDLNVDRLANNFLEKKGMYANSNVGFGTVRLKIEEL